MLKSALTATFMATFLLMSSASFTYAQDTHKDVSQDERTWKIASVDVTEVEAVDLTAELPTQPTPPTTPPTQTPPTAPTIPAGNPLGDIIAVIDSMIALGKKIWPIIEAGRPVITTKLVPAISILPHIEGENPSLNNMGNWSVPKVRSYRVSFKNGWGSEVVGFNYTLYWQYNGDYKGVGKYVTNLKVQASEIYTAWGFNFDATSELVGISNVGTSSEPVASGIIQVAYTVKGLLNEVRSAQSFFVDGAGNFQVLNN